MIIPCRYSRIICKAVTELFDVAHNTVFESDQSHQLVGSEIVGPVFDHDFDVRAIPNQQLIILRGCVGIIDARIAARDSAAHDTALLNRIRITAVLFDLDHRGAVGDDAIATA